VATAVVLTVLFGWTHIAGLVRWGGAYTPFGVVGASAIVFDETVAYAAPVKESLEGRLLSGNPHGNSYKEPNGSAVGRALPTVLLSLLARVTGGVAHAFIAADLVFPLLAAVVAFLLARSLGVSRLAAGFCALAVTIGVDFIWLPLDLVRRPEATLQTLLAETPRQLEITRTWVPQASLLLMLLLIWLCHAAVRDNRTDLTVVAAFALGASFYTYAYSWPFLLAALLASSAMLMAQRRRGQAARIMLIAAGGLFVGLPLIVSFIADRGGVGPDMLRYGWGETGLDWWRNKHWLVLTAALMVVYPKHEHSKWLVVGLLAAPWLCIAASNVSRVRLQEWHWINRDLAPIVAICAVVTVDTWLSRRGRVRTGTFVSASLIVLLLGTAAQLRSTAAAMDVHRQSEERAEAYAWLRDHAQDGAVVAALDFDAMGMIPIYTDCDVFLPFSVLTPAPDAELLARFAYCCAQLGMGKAETIALLDVASDAKELHRSQEWIAQYWVLTIARRGGRLLPRDVDALSEAWDRYASSGSTRPYRLDLFWVNRARGQRLDRDHWVTVFSNSDVELARPSQRSTDARRPGVPTLQ